MPKANREDPTKLAWHLVNSMPVVNQSMIGFLSSNFACGCTQLVIFLFKIIDLGLTDSNLKTTG